MKRFVLPVTGSRAIRSTTRTSRAWSFEAGGGESGLDRGLERPRVDRGVGDRRDLDPVGRLANLVLAHGRGDQRAADHMRVDGERAVVEDLVGAAFDPRPRVAGARPRLGSEPVGELVADQRLGEVVRGS